MLKCPHCGKSVIRISDKQREAYRLVYVLGLTQVLAAQRMGVSQKSISRLLLRLRSAIPELFTKTVSSKTYFYEDWMESKIAKRF